MKFEKKYYVVVDDDIDVIWHKNGVDWDIIEFRYITKTNFLTEKQANKWKKELDETVAKINDFSFTVKQISFNIL